MRKTRAPRPAPRVAVVRAERHGDAGRRAGHAPSPCSSRNRRAAWSIARRALGRLALRSRCGGRRVGCLVRAGQGRAVRRDGAAGGPCRRSCSISRMAGRRTAHPTDEAAGRPTGTSAARAALAAAPDFALGTMGAGYGVWAAPYEQGGEFGGLGWPQKISPGGAGHPLQGPAAAPRRRPPSPWSRRTPRSPRPSASGSPSWPMTASPSRCGRCMRRATATPCFAAATGRAGPGGDPAVLMELGTVAADCLARAVARGGVRGHGAAVQNVSVRLEVALRRRSGMMGYLVVFVGAGIGGAIRHGTNIWVARLLGTALPLAHLHHQHRGLVDHGAGRRLVRASS